MADILLTPSAFTVGSASTTVTAFFSGAPGTCGFDCDGEQRTGTWPNNNPGYHSENWTGVTSTSSDGTGYYSVTLPDNDTNATRTLTLDMIMSSGTNCENTFNPQTIEITQLATAPPVKYIRFVESTTVVNGSLSSFRVYVEVSGCTLDATRKDLVSVQGDLPISIAETSRTDNSFYMHTSANTTTSARSSIVTVRFYDTDGNPYVDDIEVTQSTYSSCSFEPNNTKLDSSGGTGCGQMVAINATVTSITWESGMTAVGPQGYVLDEIPVPTYDTSGVCVTMPANTSDTRYYVGYRFTVGYINTISGTSSAKTITFTAYVSGNTGYVSPTGSCIEITYDTSESNGYVISSWPSGTKILGGSGAVQSDYSAMIDTSWIDHAELTNGTPVSVSSGFYSGSGIFTVRYYANTTYIPEYAFYDCGRVVSAKFVYADPQTDIVEIQGKAFEKTSLACITLPEGFRRLTGVNIFDACTALTCVTIPASMTEPVSQVLPNNMGNWTFSGSNVTKIFAKGLTAPQIASNTFDNMESGGTLFYPAGADYSTWLNALPNWNWATYNPVGVDTCDCMHDGENVPIIESGTTNPPSGSPYIYLSGLTYMTLDATGSCETLPIVPVNCEYSSFTASIEYNPNLSSHSTATVTDGDSGLTFCLTSNPLSAYTEVAIITVNLYDTSGNSYLFYCSLDQYGNSGSSPTAKTIVLSPEVIVAGSGDTAICTIISAVNCTYSSYTITSNGGQHYTSGPIVNGNQMCFTFSANTGSSRSETFGMQLFDTEGNSYNTFLVVSQEAKGSGGGNVPDPWSNTGDTAYTWYHNDALLRILPPTKVLAATEVNAYWPVTAHTFNNIGVRASGDVVFTYSLVADGSPEYNSHSLYAYTEDNTGTTQQVSTIKLVAFSGTSAYSASTVLMKNPTSDGWITASPNPVNAASQQNSVSVFLTLTNCQRNVSKETTDNTAFDAATWVTVTRVNNTALTFNFQENTSPQSRSTYYYAYGLDNGAHNVYCRIELIQSANSMGITITPDRSSLGKPAGSFTARVESTENGTFSFSASPWMSITSYVPSSQKGGTLYVDYYENTGDYPRTGNIWVTQQISTSPYVLTATTQLSQTNTADTAYIIITPSTVSVPRTAGEVEAQVSYGGLATAPVLVEGEGNMSIVSYSLDSTFITVAYGVNDTSMDKNKTFTVTAMSANGNVISATFTLTQGGTGLPVAPIWRDYVLSLPVPGQGYINYNVSFDGTVVYTGRAYSMGQEDIELYYNHICKPFLSNHIDFTGGFQSIRDWLGNFIITSPELGDITSVSFFEDYSYENRTMTNLMTLNNPIINEVVDGAYVPFSFFVTGSSGTVNILANGQQLTGLTVADNEQHRYFVEAQLGTTYQALGVTYKTIDACEARYSLYYVNSFGGVDVLPCKGRSFKKTDTVTRMNYSRSFRNNTLEFENVNYMNEIKPAWELNTSYMVDSQSRKMNELVESTCVYLYDAEEQTYTPVVMTDKKLEYKTYFNQGRKFYTYTINVEESQSKERR